MSGSNTWAERLGTLDAVTRSGFEGVVVKLHQWVASEWRDDCCLLQLWIHDHIGVDDPRHVDVVAASADQGRPTWLARDRRIDLAISGLFVVLTAVLGGVRLSRHLGMWRDEAATAGVVSVPFVDMWSVINRREPGMGPYYVGLWLWTRLGHSDVWIRAFSVLGSSVAVLLVFRLTLRWFSRWPAVIAATILMVSPFMHRYQTEARTYAWTMAVAVGMAFLGDMWVRRPSIVSSLGFGALAGVGAALSPLFVLWVGSLTVVVWLAGARRDVRLHDVAPVALAAVVCAAPFAPGLLRIEDQLDWIQQPTLRSAIDTTTFLLGGRLFAIGLLAGGTTLVIALILQPSRWREMRFSAPLLLGYLTIVLLAIVSWVIKPLFVARYSTASAPFIAIAAVAGWTTVRIRLQQVALAATAALSLLVFARSRPLFDVDRPGGEDLEVAAPPSCLDGCSRATSWCSSQRGFERRSPATGVLAHTSTSPHRCRTSATKIPM